MNLLKTESFVHNLAGTENTAQTCITSYHLAGVSFFFRACSRKRSASLENFPYCFAWKWVLDHSFPVALVLLSSECFHQMASGAEELAMGVRLVDVVKEWVLERRNPEEDSPQEDSPEESSSEAYSPDNEPLRRQRPNGDSAQKKTAPRIIVQALKGQED